MSIRLEQTQKQTVSQKMIQSVSVLQMSTQELADYIKEVTLENPVLDFDERIPEDKEQERLKKLEWLASLDEQNRSYYQYDQDDAENDKGMNNVAGRTDERLEDVLRLQLLGKAYSEKEREVFEYIIQCLDSKGYFTVPAAEVAMVSGVSVEEAEACIAIMRDLEPAGVCAASMQDCLLKQMEKRKDCGNLEREIVANYMELLGKNQLQAIARILKVPLAEAVQAAGRIRELNPRPAQGFDNGDLMRYVMPDITVVKFRDGFEILLNDYTCPTLHINKEYMGMLKSECDQEVREYLSAKIRQAEELQACISRRSSTLLALAKCIVDVQKDFFIYGEKSVKPFRMTDAAERIGCHESTVSRALKDKYLQCCWGVYPLHYFFQKGLGQQGQGAEGIASLQIKQAMAEIIEGENKQEPYSDSSICELLKEQGVDISRRTVAKYREEMNIANCRGRKAYV